MFRAIAQFLMRYRFTEESGESCPSFSGFCMFSLYSHLFPLVSLVFHPSSKDMHLVLGPSTCLLASDSTHQVVNSFQENIAFSLKIWPQGWVLTFGLVVLIPCVMYREVYVCLVQLDTFTSTNSHPARGNPTLLLLQLRQKMRCTYSCYEIICLVFLTLISLSNIITEP